MFDCMITHTSRSHEWWQVLTPGDCHNVSNLELDCLVASHDISCHIFWCFMDLLTIFLQVPIGGDFHSNDGGVERVFVTVCIFFIDYVKLMIVKTPDQKSYQLDNSELIQPLRCVKYTMGNRSRILLIVSAFVLRAFTLAPSPAKNVWIYLVHPALQEYFILVLLTLEF